MDKVEPLCPSAKHTVEDWSAYNELYRNIQTISNTNALNSLGLMPDMAMNVEAMSMQIPSDLKDDEVEEKIQKIDSEVMDFYQHVDNTELRERVVQRHLNEILEAFDDLNKALNEVAQRQHT